MTTTDRCPICHDPMPRAKRDRRVSRNGVVVCGKATCEERANDTLCERQGCPREVYARGLCGPHYKREARGSTSDAPVRERGTEPLRSLSLRLPESVHAALGESPGAEARRVLTEWAARKD